METRMRKLLLVLIACVAGTLSAQQPDPPAPPPATDDATQFVLRGVTQDIPISDMILLTSEYQGIKFLYDPKKVVGEVTIVAPREGFAVPRGAMFSVLQTFLKQFRLILTPFGEDSPQSVRFYEIIAAN